ncbi:MAG: hypothetical protein JGK17_22670 [Microcoleus sp. PH2017_10_PVI_O_A]|nr:MULTISPECIES: hypothetical protein [unclassified Microcoleus]MCC3408339.1 hypothetical protein [Microcoleus sp. PH2017_10_PVI_O_A]MCC3462398.1 hypothetical protein [Microcoleus sp. PH2017_11_PCY_U_A]MCC3480888.1 hypothetical protein [Microcoleus sp. PH2017_12_PCY_D_A]MCC3561802.1 hypothetical protein [Microcoleus sp. PH2017_27_LUM_O_A]
MKLSTNFMLTVGNCFVYWAIVGAMSAMPSRSLSDRLDDGRLSAIAL